MYLHLQWTKQNPRKPEPFALENQNNADEVALEKQNNADKVAYEKQNNADEVEMKKKKKALHYIVMLTLLNYSFCILLLLFSFAAPLLVFVLLKELMATDGNHGDESHKLLEVALGVAIRVQTLHQAIHRGLVFHLLAGSREGDKPINEHSYVLPLIPLNLFMQLNVCNSVCACLCCMSVEMCISLCVLVHIFISFRLYYCNAL